MEDEKVKQKIESYPDKARTFASEIRSLIYAAAEHEGIYPIEESLKWGEPSFKAPSGSPIRMDWKPNNPDIFFVFFNCNTTLVETFREIYGSELKFEGKRAIVLDISQKIPKSVLRHCLSLALRYHKIKKLPLLGA